MPIERPTFHESWYRVSELHPRMRSTVQISRQYFRGKMWHVVQDHTNNAFFRLGRPAYTLIGLLDGKRTVAQAWNTCNEQLGDDAPTQGETIQLLGQLYTSNLLQAELPPDAESMFKRYKQRVKREVQGYLTNLLFIRIPLIDPDMMLNKFLALVGWIFGPFGLVVWLGLFAAALYTLGSMGGDVGAKLVGGAHGILAPRNWLFLYLAFALDKAIHEFGHAIACKKFGRQSGTGGEVHTMGIMFLVFTPIPYVDASSAWALKSKWQRAMVGAAGMWMEFALASVAAMVWANTGGNSTIHALAYNVMFIASVSTVLFNGNPLLRYDGYYILSDLAEIPNLAQRSKEFIFYIVKRFVWGLRQARNPAHSRSEDFWLFFYALASGAMRVLVSIGIFLFLAEQLKNHPQLLIIVLVLASAALLVWITIPIGRFIKYLFSSPELLRVRKQAVSTTLAGLALAVVLLGVVPAPNRCRAEAVAAPAHMAEVFAGADGFVTGVRRSNSVVRGGAKALAAGQNALAKGSVLVKMRNWKMTSQLAQLHAQRSTLRAQYNRALAKDFAMAQIVHREIRAVNQEIADVHTRLGRLTVYAPRSGLWLAPDIMQKKGMYLKHGQPIGFVADPRHIIIKAVADQDIAGLIKREGLPNVQIRLDGRPGVFLRGVIQRIAPAGQDRLPSQALGYYAGGLTAVNPRDPQGMTAMHKFFEIRIKPQDGQKLLPGQRVVVRFDLPPKPLLAQAWDAVMQMIQQRFHV